MLTRLDVHSFRILSSVRLEPAPDVNLITGRNGSGKTSLLEAIHLLGNGHSFRTRQIRELIRHGDERIVIFGRLGRPDGSDGATVGAQKSGRESQLRINGVDVSGQADLARLLPVRALHPESHRLVSGSPKLRRSFLDWGVFHVEQSFIDHWRRYQQVIRQRNAALRSSDRRLLGTLTAQTVELGAVVDGQRAHYVAALRDELAPVAAALLPEKGVTIHYRRGWDASRSLAESLDADDHRDRRDGVTHSGPHRADLVIGLGGHAAAEVASRGQQKALVAALVLAQVVHFNRALDKSCVVLLDDLPSELDQGHRSALLDRLRALGSQVFITAIDEGEIGLTGWNSLKRFHVEQGEVAELV